MTAIFQVMWPDVLFGADREHATANTAKTWAERQYCANAGDPDDDPDYVHPELTWREIETDGARQWWLYDGKKLTAVYVDEATASCRCGHPFCAGDSSAKCGHLTLSPAVTS